jgi:deoxyribonuclease (pyrimidine dimer)
MVRINLINPKNLTDQHLIAEYNEILMMVGFFKKHPKTKEISKNYCLGKRHINFFRNKLLYLDKRFIQLKKEMIKRGFKANKNLNLKKFNKCLYKDWKPSIEDKKIIKKRLIEKIDLKPDFYRYKKEKRKKRFFINLIKK